MEPRVLTGVSQRISEQKPPASTKAPLPPYDCHRMIQKIIRGAFMTEPTYEELRARLADLEKQVETKKRSGAIEFRVSEKGGVSVYGLGRCPSKTSCAVGHCFPSDRRKRGSLIPRLWLLGFRRGLCFLFLLLLGVFGPRWNYSDKTRIGDRLAEVFGSMAGNKQKHATFGVLSAEPVQALVEVRVGHSRDRFAGMGKRVLKRGDHLGLFRGGFLESFHIEAGRWRCPNQLIEVVVGRRHMQKYCGERAHIGRRTPGVFVRRHSFRQARELVFLNHHLSQNF